MLDGEARRHSRRTATAIGVLALVVAAFLAGVVVGSVHAGEPTHLTTEPAFSPAPSLQLPDVGVDPRPPKAALPLPDVGSWSRCRFANEPLKADPWADWDTIVLDTARALAPLDVPPDLVSTASAGLNGGHLIRAIVIHDLRLMARAARAAGAGLAVQSAFRSFAEQEQTFAYWVAADGRRKALAHSARPGHSEHQLGTTIDFTSAEGAPPWRGEDWAGTDAGAWLMDHAWRFGFVLSYPRGERSQTCYAYEPWHYRYVGRKTARAIHDSGMAPREWLLRP